MICGVCELSASDANSKDADSSVNVMIIIN